MQYCTSNMLLYTLMTNGEMAITGSLSTNYNRYSNSEASQWLHSPAKWPRYFIPQHCLLPQ